METQDTRSPYVAHQSLKVVFVSDNSFSIRWEKAKDKVTPLCRIRYVVGLKETDNANDSWHIVAEEMDMDSFTFKGLKRYTRYSCYVRAYDEAGNMTQYPGSDSCLTVTTRWSDSGPTARDSKIKVTNVTQHSISIQWEGATDDFTAAKNIRYELLIGEKGVPMGRRIVHQEKNICTYTFKGLEMRTPYTIEIWAVDEAGYAMIYPGIDVLTQGPDSASPTVKNKDIEVTDVKAHSISIQWEKATDDVSLQKDLRYQIALKEAGDKSPSTIIFEGKGVNAHTIRELKSNTAYSIHVLVIDEANHASLYGGGLDGLIVTTLEDNTGDQLAPTVWDSHLRVSDVTNRSITIEWYKATDNATDRSDIVYLVGISEAGSNQMWHIDREGKDFCVHTFQGLKPDTAYSIFVKAYDKAGNVHQYPGPDAYLTAATKSGDNQAPTVLSKHLTVRDVTETTIAIEWERAKDNLTQDKDIRYAVALTEADNQEDSWHIVREGTDFNEFTFKMLKPDTRYSFFVMAIDEAGNMIQYPGLDRSVTVKTLSW